MFNWFKDTVRAAGYGSKNENQINNNNLNTNNNNGSTIKDKEKSDDNNSELTGKVYDNTDDQELNLFLKSMKLTVSTQNDLDLLLIKINDRLLKNDIGVALQLLKQLVYVCIEPISKTNKDTQQPSDSKTYNQLYERYNIPSISKLEEVYQTTRMKSEEILRINNQSTLIEISMTLSIIQQIRFKVLNRDSSSGIGEIEQEDEGLTLYSQFQRKQILETIDPILKELNKVSGGGSDQKSKNKIIEQCYHTLKKLLHSIVDSVNGSIDTSDEQWRFNDIIKKKFNLSLVEWNTSDLILPLHNQSAHYIGEIYSIISEKLDDRRLIQDLQDTQLQFERILGNFQYNQQWVDSINGLFVIDEMLNFLSSISEISMKYIHFIQGNLSTSPIHPLEMMKSKIQEIITLRYVMYESYYFQLSFSKFIYSDNLRYRIYQFLNPQLQINDPTLLLQPSSSSTSPNISPNGSNIINSTTTSTNTNSKVSSMVDFVFFVFKKVISRSIHSLNPSGACSIINISCSNFETNFIPFIEKLIQITYSGTFDDEKRDLFLIILNDLSKTHDYLITIKQQLLDYTKQVFKRDENDQKMLTSSINGDSFSTISKTIDQILKENLEKLVRILSPSINQYIFPIRRINFQLKDQDFESYEINDPFVMDFLSNLFQLLEPYKKNLLPQNFDPLIHMISSHISSILEEHIMQTNFNHLGGIHLNKDLRKIIEFLCKLTTEQNVRHKFTKLSQISQILTFDKVNDILDYWGQEGYNWKLNPLQIKLVLGRRTDFQKNLINNLKLIELPVIIPLSQKSPPK